MTDRDTLIDYDKYNDVPHVFIQWKGTDACVDLYCECGTHGHIDGDFLYFVTCKDCGRVYQMDCQILMHEITDEEWKRELAKDGRPKEFSHDSD